MDAEQGLQYLRARWYAPGMGRFVSADTWNTPDGAYRYTGNSPIMRVDPSGHVGIAPLMIAVTIVSVLAALPGCNRSPAGVSATKKFRDLITVTTPEYNAAVGANSAITLLLDAQVPAVSLPITVTQGPYEKPPVRLVAIQDDIQIYNAGTLRWNPWYALWTAPGGRLSPMTALYHELLHAYVDTWSRVSPGGVSAPTPSGGAAFISSSRDEDDITEKFERYSPLGAGGSARNSYGEMGYFVGVSGPLIAVDDPSIPVDPPSNMFSGGL